MNHLKRLNQRGATVVEYIVLVFLMTISIFAVIEPMGKRISSYFDYLSYEVAAMQEHIATVNVEMDEITGSWIITEVSEDTKVSDGESAEEAPADDQAADGSDEDGTETGTEQDGSTDTPSDTETDTSPEAGGETGTDPPGEEVAPVFSLTTNNGINHAAIDFSRIDVPHKSYRFTLSGTGDTAPKAVKVASGDRSDGWTLIDKIQIQIVKPKKNRIERITLIINGQTITWDVRHDHHGGTTPNKKNKK